MNSITPTSYARSFSYSRLLMFLRLFSPGLVRRLIFFILSSIVTILGLEHKTELSYKIVSSICTVLGILLILSYDLTRFMVRAGPIVLSVSLCLTGLPRFSLVPSSEPTNVLSLIRLKLSDLIVSIGLTTPRAELRGTSSLSDFCREPKVFSSDATPKDVMLVVLLSLTSDFLCLMVSFRLL